MYYIIEWNSEYICKPTISFYVLLYTRIFGVRLNDPYASKSVTLAANENKNILLLLCFYDRRIMYVMIIGQHGYVNYWISLYVRMLFHTTVNVKCRLLHEFTFIVAGYSLSLFSSCFSYTRDPLVQWTTW